MCTYTCLPAHLCGAYNIIHHFLIFLSIDCTFPPQGKRKYIVGSFLSRFCVCVPPLQLVLLLRMIIMTTCISERSEEEGEKAEKIKEEKGPQQYFILFFTYLLPLLHASFPKIIDFFPKYIMTTLLLTFCMRTLLSRTKR